MLEIRLAQTPEEKEQVFKLRYQIYVEELGYSQHYADQQQQKIEEPLDRSGNIFGAFKDGKLLGTVRCNYSSQSDLGYYVSLYNMSEITQDAHPMNVSVSTKFMVDTNFRRKGIGLVLMQANYNQLLLDKVKLDFIDCEPHMIGFFQKLGYQPIDMINHPEYGSGLALMLDVFNFEHLQRVKSPFQRLYRNFLESKECQYSFS
ncbi:GNAT family N-acetyltransferase [Microcoleus sp. B4-C5]|uniref:GNAT family N-acetyltransferase n=1 Tax=unclassified Microcoleus TaxID=2642155 RepID=UPI002FD1D18B